LVAEQNVGFAVSFAGSAPAGPSSYREKVRGGRALFAKLARRQCSKAVWVGYRFFWFSNFGILKILLGQAAQNDVPRVRWR
jgi:hypothetical protein